MDEDETQKAVREGEYRALREWYLERGKEVPDEYKDEGCKMGLHILTLDRPGCVKCGKVSD